MRKLNEYYIAILIFTALSLIILFPLFTRLNYLGTGDWDQHLFYYGVARETILKHHQLPLWNPYYCGGNVLLAHPESVWLNPFFIIILIFGEVIGLKIQLFLHLVLGMLGMFLLSKYYKLGKFSSWLPPVVYMLSSWFFTHLLVGHTLYLTMAYLPFVFLFYLKSFENRKYIILSSLFMLMMFLGGGTYPFAFTLLFLSVYSFFEIIKLRNLNPFISLILIVALSLLLGAVKFLPTYEFTKEIGYPINDIQPVSFKSLLDGLLSRNQEMGSRKFYSEFEFPKSWFENGILYTSKLKVKTIWNWHEYSAYIGIIVFILFVSSLFFLFRKEWDLILTAFVFTALYFGNKAYLWIILKLLPLYSTLHGTSRFRIILIFLIAILSGKMLSYFEGKAEGRKNKKSYLIPFLILIVVLDMASISYPFAKMMFFIEQPGLNPSPEFYHLFVDDKFYEQYKNFKENKGAFNCYERLHLALASNPKYLVNGSLYPQYKGESYLVNKKGVSRISYFSPNKVKIMVDSKQDDILVYNMNYFKGWKAKAKEVKPYNGMVAANISPDDKEVIFYYLPNSFIIGFFISLIGSVIVIWYLRIS